MAARPSKFRSNTSQQGTCRLCLRTVAHWKATSYFTASCQITSEEAAGAILIIKRGCNVYDTVRAAANFGAVMVVFADDATAKSAWVPRDRTLSLPVLSVGYAAADAMQTMIRRGKDVRGSLGSEQYCDLMHASGLVGSDTCCVAGDVVVSRLLFDYDFWNVGVREFPFCRGGSTDGEMKVECAEPHENLPRTRRRYA